VNSNLWKELVHRRYRRSSKVSICLVERAKHPLCFVGTIIDIPVNVLRCVQDIVLQIIDMAGLFTCFELHRIII
jgi:hypothetical protein